jgi:hypothetical protein
MAIRKSEARNGALQKAISNALGKEPRRSHVEFGSYLNNQGLPLDAMLHPCCMEQPAKLGSL